MRDRVVRCMFWRQESRMGEDEELRLSASAPKPALKGLASRPSLAFRFVWTQLCAQSVTLSLWLDLRYWRCLAPRGRLASASLLTGPHVRLPCLAIARLRGQGTCLSERHGAATGVWRTEASRARVRVAASCSPDRAAPPAHHSACRCAAQV